MYSLKTFQGALTLATAKPTRRYFSVTSEQGGQLLEYIDHLTANTAAIALSGPVDGLGQLDHLDVIRAAAQRLAEIETADGFSWEKCGSDWETTCAKIGAFIAKNHEAPSVENIRAEIG